MGTSLLQPSHLLCWIFQGEQLTKLNYSSMSLKNIHFNIPLILEFSMIIVVSFSSSGHTVKSELE